MNFLAHLYLSKNHTNILIGNFIADGIQGNQFTHLSSEIQQGIALHRHIDTYTDAHPIVRKSKRRLHKRYGHYDGVIIDLFYDHFLARNWNQYSAIPLDIYVKSVYQLLQEQVDILPLKTQQFLPHLIAYDWLYNYQFFDGMEAILNGMNRRTQLKSKMNMAIEDLKDLHQEFENDFTLFFKDLCIFSDRKLKEIQESTL
ncbi:MAG: acyl carrier protein phosphodiesterase [Polaribacter sp.]|nr:acyl carrier protein phosphodiesterase [Polaribacter sp.]